ncbi:MAG: phage minor capsid protein [Bacteroidota bacterium]
MAVKPPRGVLLSKAEADRLAKLYMKAELEIVKAINQALERRNDTRYLRAMLENVKKVQADLLKGTRAWSEQAVPRLYREGMKEAESQLQRAGLSVKFGFGAVHQQAVQVLAENSYRRLADIVQVIGRRTEDLYRETALEATRQSIIGYKTWSEVAGDIRKRLQEQGVTAFEDRRGRKWNLSTYSEMVARTTTAEAHLAGTGNRLLENGHDLVIISSHGSPCEKCTKWEGRVISLTGKTPGYPTLEHAKGEGLFHPNCRHTYYWQLEIEAAEKTADGRQVPEEASFAPRVSLGGRRGLSAVYAEAWEHGLATGKECVLTIDANSGALVYTKITGTSDSVSFPARYQAFLGSAADDSIIVVHNHPSSSGFSPEDIRTLALPSLAGMGVIGHDGTRYYIGKQPGAHISGPRLVADWWRAYSAHFDYYSQQVLSGRMTEAEAWREHSHRIAEDLARADNLEYRRRPPSGQQGP